MFYPHLAQQNSRQTIVNYVLEHGRKVYSRRYIEERLQWCGEAEFEIEHAVPLKAAA